MGGEEMETLVNLAGNCMGAIPRRRGRKGKLIGKGRGLIPRRRGEKGDIDGNMEGDPPERGRNREIIGK